MRQLGMYAAVLAVTTTASLGRASPPPGWSEYGVAQPLRPFEQLSVSSCDVAVEIRGAIAEVSMRQDITNPGPAALAAATELELPAGAELVGMALRSFRGKSEAAVPVNVSGQDIVKSPRVLGADPALVTRLPTHETGRPRFSLIVQPIEAEQEVTVETRWTSVVDIQGGALRLLLPGRGPGAPTCKVLAHVQPGPGASVARMRVDNIELGPRSTASFDIGANDATLSVALAFKRNEPLLWVQRQALGEGYTAQAATVLAPPLRSTDARRALLVIDGSRSMELVGRHNVSRLVDSIGSALPQKAEVEAVIFDRAPRRILGGWKPATTENIDAIEAALAKRTATNGSDLVGALSYARQLLADSRGQPLVILVTDGVLGGISTDALTQALGGSPTELDLHVIALSPGGLRPPDSVALRSSVTHFGGSFNELPVRELDDALATLDSWLRPAWQELALTGTTMAGASELRAGSGIVVLDVVKQPGKLALTGRRERPVTVGATSAPTAPLAQLALAGAGDDDETVRARLRERHVAVDDSHPFAVLSTTGNVAASRRQVVTGGGPYTRMIAVPDPTFPTYAVQTSAAVALGGSAVDRNTVTLLLRQYLQPAAFSCYQKALATNPGLAGTAQFKLEIGRGELTRAAVTGVGNATFDTCLLEAAYQITPPLPNPDFNLDDRTIVNYPLSFSVREQKAFVLAGDADSSSPLDIDAIEGGVPVTARRRPVKAVDSSTPLGNLRPAPAK